MFLESYSNSPEWTRFENPVTYMEDETLPEELEHGKPPEQLQNEELFATRCKGRQPESEHTQHRHPLSQVTNAGDVASPLPNPLQPQGTVQQGDGRPGVPISIIDDSEENEQPLSHASADDDRDDAPINIEDDRVEEEEPEDDTFEFLFTKGRNSG